jgi:hypothetical protein
MGPDSVHAFWIALIRFSHHHKPEIDSTKARIHYNQGNSHGSLSYLTPKELAARLSLAWASRRGSRNLRRQKPTREVNL